MTSAQRTILLTGLASGVTGLVAIVTFLFAPLRTVYSGSGEITSPEQVSTLHLFGPLGAQLWGPILFCLLLLLGITVGALWRVRGQTTGGPVLLWTSTVLLALVISDKNILLTPLMRSFCPVWRWHW